MKTAMIACFGALMLAPAAFASFSDVKEEYVADAFADADDEWLRLTANRYSECGVYGSNEVRRIDVLVGKYRALGEALDAGNDAAASEAARSLYDSINNNVRFEACWDKVSRKEGISRSFKRNLKEL